MNNFSYSLSCTWMTIIDRLFYASDSFSWDVSWEYIAKLLKVAWLYFSWDSGQFINPYNAKSCGVYIIYMFIVLKTV